MLVKIEKSWKKVLEAEFDKEYWKKLSNFVRNEYQSSIAYPPPQFVFNAFDLTPFDSVEVVILGQDPYHGPHQAHGLCFSVPGDVAKPPSLKNIIKEIQSDTKTNKDTDGDLTNWAKQGVLLLNTTLTVRSGIAGSHQNNGWEIFTDKVIETISKEKENVVFLLWGNYAINKKRLIDSSKHLILEAPHPSPLSAYRGFFGCKHFSKANYYLRKNGIKEINWVK